MCAHSIQVKVHLKVLLWQERKKGLKKTKVEINTSVYTHTHNTWHVFASKRKHEKVNRNETQNKEHRIAEERNKKKCVCGIKTSL